MVRDSSYTPCSTAGGASRPLECGRGTGGEPEKSTWPRSFHTTVYLSRSVSFCGPRVSFRKRCCSGVHSCRDRQGTPGADGSFTVWHRRPWESVSVTRVGSRPTEVRRGPTDPAPPTRPWSQTQRNVVNHSLLERVGIDDLLPPTYET